MKSARLRKVLSITGNVLLWLFVAFAVFMTILVFSSQSSKDAIPGIMGKGLITIQSDSMDPTFKSGDLIICDVLTDDAKRELQKGDVITFYSDLNGDGTNELNTHRIVDRYEKGGYVYYVTKGDNNTTNPVNDKSPVISQNVVARYTGTAFAGVGNAINFLQSSLGFMLIIVIPLVIFFLYELYCFIMQVRKLRGKRSISKEEEEEIKRRAVEEYLRQQGENKASDTQEVGKEEFDK